MTVRGIHHVGIAVADLDEALATYERLFGATLEHRSTVPDQGVHALSVLVGEDRIELVSPTGADTPVGRFLASRGPGMHHVAYEVDDVGAALAGLAEAGAQLIDEAPRPGLFIAPSNIVRAFCAFARRSPENPGSNPCRAARVAEISS